MTTEKSILNDVSTTRYITFSFLHSREQNIHKISLNLEICMLKYNPSLCRYFFLLQGCFSSPYLNIKKNQDNIQLSNENESGTPYLSYTSSDNFKTDRLQDLIINS